MELWYEIDNEDTAASISTPQYTFSVWESITNLGPIGDSIVGESQDPASNSHGIILLIHQLLFLW